MGAQGIHMYCEFQPSPFLEQRFFIITSFVSVFVHRKKPTYIPHYRLGMLFLNLIARFYIFQKTKNKQTNKQTNKRC